MKINNSKERRRMQEIKNQLKHEEVKHFLTLPKERLLIAKRQHWLVLVFPLSTAFVSGILLTAISYLLFVYYFQDVLLLVSAVVTVSAVMTTFIIHRIIDWYFHIYIITDRKILEVSFVPMFSQVINHVLLDQVRTTEVDSEICDILHELFDVGDVVIEFDRPSHDKTFVLRNIKDPKNTGIFIADTFEAIMHDSPIWFHPRNFNSMTKFNDDITDKSSFEKNII